MVTDPASAETIKYASNAFLATKLSFVNAVAAVCEAVGADVNDVVLGMGYDKRIGHEFLRPGPGWGGSCFPKDTRALLYIAEDAGYDFDLLEGVIEVNDEQFDRVADKVVDAWPAARVDGVTVARVGPHLQGPHRRPARVAVARDRRAACSAPGADDARPTTPTVTRPAARGARRLEIVADPYAACEGADVLVVLTEWDEFKWLDLDKVADADGATAASSTPATCSTARRWSRRGLRLPGHRPELMARVVVTGGAGFLGSHLCDALLDRGDEVVVLDNLVTGAAGQHRAPLRATRASRFVEHDVSQLRLGARRGRRRAALRQPGVAEGLPRDADPDPEGRQPRHPQRARPGQGQGRPFFLASTSEVYGDPRCTRSPRPTGATSTRSGPAASTTRPSGSPRP